MNLIKFGTYTPPTPTKFEIELSDIDSEGTGRGETGEMDRERVRADVYKVSVAFTNISSDDVSNIKEAISGEEFEVTLFDGSYVTIRAYSGNRTLSLKSVDDMSNAFWDMSFSLTEM